MTSSSAARKHGTDAVWHAVAASAEDIKHGRIIDANDYVTKLEARLERMKRNSNTREDNQPID
ncbi:MAG: hypothetical protein WCC64_20635 [Aliidongia sp.]